MQTKNFALIFFFIFITILFVLSQTLEPRLIQIKEISQNNIDEKIKIIGNAEKITLKSNITLISISDSTGIIAGVAYEPVFLNKSILYSFYGKIKEYNNELEIEIEKIKLE